MSCNRTYSLLLLCSTQYDFPQSVLPSSRCFGLHQGLVSDHQCEVIDCFDCFKGQVDDH
jgi:hypothetical protein